MAKDKKKKEEKPESVSPTEFEFPISSLVPDKRPKPADPNGTGGISEDHVRAVLEETTDKLNNVNGIFELHPDLKLAMEVRTSMLLSPKDMIAPGFHLTVDPDIYDGDIPTDLLSFLEGKFKTLTKIESKMSTFVDDALFKYGAHIWLMLPPNNLDAVIAQRDEEDLGIESIDDLKQYFNESPVEYHSDRLGLLGVDGITANLNLLRKKELTDAINDRHTAKISMESMGYQAPIFKKRPLQRIRDLGRDVREEGYPILYELPMDSVLPLYEPSDPSMHTGYLIPIDPETGTFITNMEEANYFDALAQRLERALKAQTGTEWAELQAMGLAEGTGVKDRNAEELLNFWKSALLEQVQSALKDTPGGETVKVQNHDSIYRLMFSRALSRQKTRLLYVPEWAVDYMAFKYDSSGQGVSLLQETQLFSALRAIVMFSDLIRQVNNSIPQTDLNITLDESDKDPMGTVQTLMQEYGRITQRKIPLGTFNPASLMDELRRGGLRVRVQGGDKFPNTSLEQEDRSRQIIRPDAELSEYLKRAQYAGLVVPPEVVDETLQGNFAINSLISNTLFIKNSMADQAIFKELMHRRIAKYIMLSGPLYDKIVATVGEAKADTFIASLQIMLPSADMSRIEAQMQAYQNYSEFVDEVMEDHISDAMLRGLLKYSPAADALEELRGHIAAHFKREYMRRENMLPELFDLHDVDSAETVSDRIKDYHESLFKTVGVIITDLMRRDKRLNDKVEKLEGTLGDGEDDPNGPSPGGDTPDIDPFGGAPAFPFEGDLGNTPPPPSPEDLPEPEEEVTPEEEPAEPPKDDDPDTDEGGGSNPEEDNPNPGKEENAEP